ncbi:MAG: ankyrin repeat domain-containing protein [Acidobacteria bacterium]|nr:ankyrin repeat domain-containing protein [Acidobacteriota bacterium]
MISRLSRAALMAAGLAVSAVALYGQSGTPPLIEAVRNQDHDAVRALLTEQVDVNAPQPDGATALHWAVHWENLELADLLIGAGADVNVANDLEVTPLVMACTSGNAALVGRLLVAGADPNATLASGETVLMAAARAGSLEAVDALVDRGAEVNATETTRGQSALMWAVANRHPEITRALLDHGADVHARSSTRTLVFSMGGSRSAGSASGGISLEEVEQGGSTPLLFAARSGDLESARLLVAAGADVEDTTADGNTALVIAAHSGHGSLAAYLLDEGADANAAPLGYTALHAAVVRGNLLDRDVLNLDPGAGVSLVRALVAHGADPNARLIKGTPVRRWSHDFAFMARWVGATPLWLAAKFLEVDMMRVLVEAGADLRLASSNGTTPLMAAAGLGYSWGGGSAFIKNRRDFSSYNPVASAELGTRIPEAEERRALETVTVALELGADVNAANDGGDTALHAAASLGMNTVIELLMDRGGDVSAENRRGQTPVDVAVYADGIGGNRFVRESTAALLRPPEDSETAHPTEPHSHPEAGALANPTPTTPESVEAGAATYARHCATCHGSTGRGDGRLAAATAAYGARPSNLADTTWQHGSSDGELFVAIRDGIEPDFAMDAFRERLTEPDIWNLVNYLKSLR